MKPAHDHLKVEGLARSLEHAHAGECVRQAESAFAATMAARDLEAFMAFVSRDAVFLGETVIHFGHDAVRAAWAAYFEGSTAPFSWQADEVLVLRAGDCALSRGPVLDALGRRVGTFTSVWRKESDGQWRVIHDRGEAWTASGEGGRALANGEQSGSQDE